MVSETHFHYPEKYKKIKQNIFDQEIDNMVLWKRSFASFSILDR